MLYFITGNKNKFSDAQSFFPDLVQLDIDLDEIQSLDSKIIIKAKLEEALKHQQGEFIVDDVSVSFEGLNGFPGPLIRWFMGALGPEGMADVVEKTGKTNMEVRTILGYAKSLGEVHYFESQRSGNVVRPRGKAGFGWDVIFQPEGSNQTYAEMKEAQPGPNDMRRDALMQLKQFLEQNHE